MEKQRRQMQQRCMGWRARAAPTDAAAPRRRYWSSESNARGEEQRVQLQRCHQRLLCCHLCVAASPAVSVRLLPVEQRRCSALLLMLLLLLLLLLRRWAAG